MILYLEDDGFRPWPKNSNRSSLIYLIHKHAKIYYSDTIITLANIFTNACVVCMRDRHTALERKWADIDDTPVKMGNMLFFAHRTVCFRLVSHLNRCVTESFRGREGDRRGEGGRV